MTFWEWLASLVKPTPKPPVPAPVPPPPVDLTAVRARVITLHNQYRSAHGLSPLVANASLNNAAQAHSEDMATHHNLSHIGSDGSTLAERLRRAGYALNAASENIAEGQMTADAVFDDWVKDPPHLADITGPYRNIGVGLSGTYWTCDFASPR